MVVTVKVHFDGKALILDEPASLPLDTQMNASIDVPVREPTVKKKRVWGQFAGMGWMSDDFDDPLPDSFWDGEE